jgi:hypothetical protein
VLLPWTVLRPSVRERRWRRAGQAIAGLAAIALAAAAFNASFDVPLLLLAVGAAFACWLGGRRRRTETIEIAVDDGGAVCFRNTESPRSDEAQGRVLECAFAAPWLITLRHGTMLLPVWPDSMPEKAFRRLWVYLRWSRGVRSDSQAPANDAERR